jgi:hypothetical protein
MVDLVEQYDPEAESNGFDALPAGTYTAQIVENSREVISKDKDCGDCLSLCWKVTEGPLEGRLFWQRLNLWWTGPEKTAGQVVKIANGQFADVRKATGVLVPNDADELMFVPCLVTYGPQKNDDRYSEVKSVKPVGAAPDRQATPRAANSSMPAHQAAAATKAAPWPRKTA